jgi:hypothetical protein
MQGLEPGDMSFFDKLRNSLLAVVFILALPVILPVAAILHARYRHRLRGAAEKTACTVCGAILGSEALDKADEFWRAHVAKLHRDNPGVRFRLVRLVHAICVRCSAEYTFRETTRSFHLRSRP